jgi:hypothetical protein
MHRERVSENVYWFQSEIYAQVTAGVVTGPQWAVVIDTLALPDEALAMRAFIEEELAVPVRYIIIPITMPITAGEIVFFQAQPLSPITFAAN